MVLTLNHYSSSWATAIVHGLELEGSRSADLFVRLGGTMGRLSVLTPECGASLRIR